MTLEHLDAVLLDDVRESWHRAIRAEVTRTTKAGNPPRSGYLRRKRPALHALLIDVDERRAVAASADAARSWWLGVNQGSGGHMQIGRVRPFVKGLADRLVWPIGHSKPKRLYVQMRTGDRVLLWMGHGKKEAQWGFLGTAAILEAHEDRIVLGHARPFERVLTPYPRGLPARTDETVFLRERFGEDFAPLGDVMHAVFGTRKRDPITVAEVPQAAFDAVVMRATRR